MSPEVVSLGFSADDAPSESGAFASLSSTLLCSRTASCSDPHCICLVSALIGQVPAGGGETSSQTSHRSLCCDAHRAMLQITRCSWLAGCPSSRPSLSVPPTALNGSPPESTTLLRKHEAGVVKGKTTCARQSFCSAPSRRSVPLFLASSARDDPPPACAAVVHPSCPRR